MRRTAWIATAALLCLAAFLRAAEMPADAQPDDDVSWAGKVILVKIEGPILSAAIPDHPTGRARDVGHSGREQLGPA